MYLSKNLKHLREQNGRQSQEALANALGITRSAVSSYEDGRAEPKLSVMNKMANYFNLTLDQLLNIDLSAIGNQNTDSHKEIKKYASAQNLRVLTITLDKNNNENVELVTEKYARTYPRGCSDVEYLKDLPKYNLPFLSKGKTYRAFEISGDSMLPLRPHSIVIGQFVDDWTNVQEGSICVLILREGIVLREVFNKIKERGSFLLKSSNIAYSPYEVQADSVLEIWKFVAYVSKEFPEETTSVNELRRAFARLEDDFRELKMYQQKS